MNAKQSAILQYIAEYQAEHPYCPCWRDILKATKISSSSVLTYYVYPLLDEGFLGAHFEESGKISHRTLHITEKGRRAIQQL